MQFICPTIWTLRPFTLVVVQLEAAASATLIALDT
jgi:hypothetical protein